MQFIRNSYHKKSFDNPLFDNFSTDVLENIFAFHKTVPGYNETPLHHLNRLASTIGVDKIFVKDESLRFGLNAFKGLGGIYAIASYFEEHYNIKLSSFEELLKNLEDKDQLTFVTATDGNHGKGIAWAAELLNQRALVYMPKNTSQARVDAITTRGAEVIVTELNYDDTVRYATEVAHHNNWPLVQDTAWEGYEEIPLKIMQGYSTIISEIINQLGPSDYNSLTHVFLQAGVGSFAGAMAAVLSQTINNKNLKIIIVEPENAACLYKSAGDSSGILQNVTGDLKTMMAGLSCGEPSIQGWSILKDVTDVFISCGDNISADGMKLLGQPEHDEKIISGESGSVTTGALNALMTNSQFENIRNELELINISRVLLINTEGDTDPENYKYVMNAH